MGNQLQQLAAFQEILQHYQVNEAGHRSLQKTKLTLLVAPSGIGRNTIISELVKTGRYHYIISDTTRQPRLNNGVMEKNGVEYWFRSEADILQDLRDGKFLEAAIIHNQQVSGISLREIDSARHERKTPLTDVEVVGMATIIAAKPDAHAVFVVPPSFKEWMRRLDGRGIMPISEKRRRFVSAEVEFKAALQHDYYQFVLNDSVDHAVRQIEALTCGVIDSDQQSKLRATCEELLHATVDWLTKH